jgi:hypothetical protein
MPARPLSARLWAAGIPLAIYATSRAASALFLLWAAADQPALGTDLGIKIVDPVPASPGYWDVVANWDGQWYKAIATAGYPSVLPIEDGVVAQSEWAFYPLYPGLVRLLMWATGLRFEVVAASASLICGALAVVLLHRWLSERTTVFGSAATIAALCSFPTSPILQAAYTESLALLLIVLAVRALADKRYGVFVALGLALCLTRPIALPLAAAVGAHWYARSKAEGAEFQLRDRVRVAALVPVIAAQAALWPVIAWLTTNEPKAFLATQAAWQQQPAASGIGTIVLVALLLGMAAVVLRRPARVWGVEFRAWSLGYAGYVLLATQPTLAVFRYLLLAVVPWWPFPEAGAGPNQRRIDALMRWTLLCVLVALGLFLQYHWVASAFVIDSVPIRQPHP